VPAGVPVALENHPELAALMLAWPTLADSLRAGILTLAGVATTENGQG
jgi:hypothetical protein